MATFLGGPALSAPAIDQGPGLLLVPTLIALLVGIAACIAVLLPTRTRKRPSKPMPRPKHPEAVIALSFSANVEVMLDHADERGLHMPDTTRMHTARTLQLAWDENAPIVAGKQHGFVFACLALRCQTACWITFVAFGREVICAPHHRD